MEQSTIALYLAIYGAILSTIVMIWNIRRDVKDRADIMVGSKLVQRWIMGSMFADRICIELSNVGKRPITILEIYYQFGKEINQATVTESQALPKELLEGQFFSIDILREHMPDLDKIKYFIAKDSRGIMYKSMKYPLKGKKKV